MCFMASAGARVCNVHAEDKHREALSRSLVPIQLGVDHSMSMAGGGLRLALLLATRVDACCVWVRYRRLGAAYWPPATGEAEEAFISR